MNYEEININSLPSLLIPERSNLPQTGGIYFVLAENNDVEYIGKARNLNKRWRKHECCIDLDSPKTCRVAWFEVSDENKRTEFEKQFIRKFSPKHNSNHIIKPPKPKPIFVQRKIETRSSFDVKLTTRESAGKLGVSEKYLKASEVAKQHKVTSYAVKNWIKTGLLPNAKLEQSVAGSVWLIPESDLQNFTKPEMGRPKKNEKTPN